MSELTMNRRQAVRTAAGVAAGGVLVAGAGVGAAAAHDDKRTSNGSSGLIGSWLITHRNDPPSPPELTTGIISFIGGGVLIANDIDPVGYPGSGSWAYRGDGRFVGTFWGGFPAEGTDPAGTFKVQASGRLRNGRISGTFELTVFPKGQKSFTATGTFTGTKIRAS